MNAMWIGLLLVALASRCQPPHGYAMQSPAPAPAAVADSAVGAWNGHWTAADGRRGSAGLVVSPTAEPHAVLGQFTFVVGADSRSARRQGVVSDRALRFELVGGGEIVLRRVDDRLLEGEFTDPGGLLPARRGSIQLTRVSRSGK